MAKGLTPKRENFVQAYHRLGNQRHAYREAFNAENMSDAAVDVNACKLMKDAKVSLRLAELQERSAKKNGVTVDRLSSDLDFIIEKARDAIESAATDAEASKLNTSQMLSTMRQTIMDMGKLHGLIIEKRQSEVTRKRDVSDIDDAELAIIAKSGSAGAVASEDGETESDKLHAIYLS